MSTRLVEAMSGLLASRSSRRGFLAKTTLAATALSVAPAEFILKPVTAYAAVCQCASSGCNCGDLCCDGYTEFCCTIHDGSNTCPPGTFAGGWWKADGSAYCDGPRYYIDCQAECSCGCGSGSYEYFCGPGCDGLDCGCAEGNCANRQAGCVTFRYGQCHTEIACSGRIACRVVTCVPAYLIDNSCGTNSFTDEATANHNRPCLEAPPVVVREFAWAPSAAGGYWMSGNDGGIFTFNGAGFYGSAGGERLAAPVVDLAGTPSGQGYWLVATDGGVFTYGDAGFFGSAGGEALFAPMVGILGTPSGRGYWLVAADGGIFTYGDAAFHGSIGGEHLQAPIMAMAITPTGLGYWMVASDGGVFTFGDASFEGSMGASALSAPITTLVPTPSGKGYYLLGQDGAVYCFGDGPSHGSYKSLAPDPSLLADGVDSFYGMSLSVASGAVSGYILYAVAGTSSPPQVRQYSLGG